MTTYRRTLGTTELVCLGIGGTIGSGIFVVPGTAARIAGPSMLLGWLIVAASACAIAYSLASLHSRARAGLPLARLLATSFGEPAAAALVALYVAASIIGIATIAAGLGQYLDYFGAVHVLPIELACIALFLAVNLLGIAASGASENALSVLKLMGILTIVAVLIPSFDLHRLVPHSAPPAASLLQVVVIVYWSFTGFEIAAIPASETRDPRHIARSLKIVMLLVCGVYFALNAALLGSVGAAALGAANAPVAMAVERVVSWAGPAVAALAIITMLSALNAYIVGASRALHDVAESRGISLLRPLSQRGVPALALVICCGGAALALLASNQFDVLATLAVVLTLVPYVAICWAARRDATTRVTRAIADFGAFSAVTILLGWCFSQVA